MNENSEINEISEIKCRLKYANNKPECYKQLVAEMEKSLCNQEVTITTQKSLMKISKSSKNKKFMRESQKTDKLLPTVEVAHR